MAAKPLDSAMAKHKGKKTKINREQFESKQINKILGRHGKGCKMHEAGTFLCVAEKTESARVKKKRKEKKYCGAGINSLARRGN